MTTAKKTSTQRKYKITVNYGYDIHSVTVTQKVMDQIKRGEAVTVRGKGFYIEGDKERDDWSFNCTEPNSLAVQCENGHDIFTGELGDATINEVAA